MCASSLAPCACDCVINVNPCGTVTYMYRTALLLCPAHCYAPPPPPLILPYRVILPPLHASPCRPLELVVVTAVLALVRVLQV